MRSVIGNSLKQSNKCLKNLIQMHKYQFCVSQALQTPKKQEMSNQDMQNDEASNKILESLSDSKIFQTIKPSSSAPIRHSDIEFTQWERKNRKAPKVDDSHQFASILNARSVEQIYSGLQLFRDKVKDNSKQRILNLVDNMTTTPTEEENAAAKTNSKYDYWNLCEANCKAIHVLAYLKEYDAAWKLFEDIKTNRIGLSADVFAAAIYLTMDREFSNDALDKCFGIKHEMEDEYKLKPSARIYTTLITSALDLREPRRAKGIVKTVMEMEESEKQRLLRDRNAGQFLRIAIIRYYSVKKQINNGLKFMDYCIKTMGKESINSNIYSSILACCTKLVEDGDENMIEVGEKIFKQSFDILSPRVPQESVFLSMMNMYSYIGEYNSVMDMIEEMRKNPEWPNPTSLSCSVALKALNNQGQRKKTFGYEDGWNEVDKILNLMKEDHLTPHPAVFSLLFNLCSGRFCGKPDIEKLHKYYEWMIEEGTTLNPSGVRNILLSGVDYHLFNYEKCDDENEKIKHKEECMNFVDWAMNVYKEHNLDFLHYHQLSLQHKLNKFES